MELKKFNDVAVTWAAASAARAWCHDNSVEFKVINTGYGFQVFRIYDRRWAEWFTMKFVR